MKIWQVLLADHASRVVKLTILAFVFASAASAEDLYVATNGTGDGSSWANATNNLQGAIDAISGAYATNTVWVSNGVYATGGVTNYPPGTILTNRVAIWKGITVRSASNNPANTIIEGDWDPITTNGPAAVRCVYMTNNSTLIGFTLTNGATLRTNESAVANDLYGGGVWCPSANISNCVIAGNSANTLGGGAYYGTLYNSTLSNNFVIGRGGGAYFSILYNCLLTRNSAFRPVGNSAYGGGGYGCTMYNCLIMGNYTRDNGGGVSHSDLYNCTVVGNYTLGTGGGGTRVGTLYNCIVYFNSNGNWSSSSTFINSCTWPTQTTWVAGDGNITNDPAFLDRGSDSGLSLVPGNYRLHMRSPCVNTGTNQNWMTNSVDLDGNTRIQNIIVDMGTYETYLWQGSIFTFH